jgi:hypothetical protein
MDDNSRTIQELNLYCSPNSILVLNKAGRLSRVCCPFQVRARRKVNTLEEGQVYYVAAVRLSPELVMLYIISNIAYQYNLFIVL